MNADIFEEAEYRNSRPAQKDERNESAFGAIAPRDVSLSGFRRGLLFLFILGLIVRAWYFTDHLRSPSFAFPTLDEKYYDTVARMLVAGEDLHGLHAFRPLLYPIFLAALLKTTGSMVLAPAVQHLFGIATGLIVAFLGSRLFGNRFCGLVSGAIYLLAPLPLALEGELMTEALYFFLICLGLLLHIRAADSHGNKSRWLWLLAGGTIVLAAQARPNVLIFLIIYPAFAARSWFRSRQLSSISPLLGVVGALLMGACWGFVNLKQSNSFHLLSGAGGVNLYLGNKRGAKGITVEQERRMTYSDRYQEAIEVWAREEYESAMRAQGQQPFDDPSAVSRYWTSRAVEEIKAAPGAWLGLIAKKCCLSLWNTEIPNNKSFAFLQQQSASLKWLPVRWVILLMLMPAGIWAAWRFGNRDSLFILLIYIGAYTAGNVAFFVCDRYRCAIWPPTAVIAAGGLAACIRFAQSRNFRGLSWTGLSMIAAAAISLPNWTGIQLPSFARDYFFRSIAWYEKGHFPEALADIKHSLELVPSDASALQQQGNVLFAMDQPAAAKQSFERALRLSPGEAVTLNNLGVVNERLGDTNGAIAAFRASTQCTPPSRNAFVNLACIQIRAGRFPDAEQTVASLQKMHSVPDTATLALASVLARHDGDAQHAAALEARAQSLDPATLAWVLERAGQAKAETH